MDFMICVNDVRFFVGFYLPPILSAWACFNTPIPPLRTSTNSFLRCSCPPSTLALSLKIFTNSRPRLFTYVHYSQLNFVAHHYSHYYWHAGVSFPTGNNLLILFCMRRIIYLKKSFTDPSRMSKRPYETKLFFYFSENRNPNKNLSHRFGSPKNCSNLLYKLL